MAIANRILNIIILLMAIVAVAFGWKLFDRRKELRNRGDLYADTISKAATALDTDTNDKIASQVKADDAGAKGPLGWLAYHVDVKATSTGTTTRGLMEKLVKQADSVRGQRDALSGEIKKMSGIFNGLDPEVTVLNDPTLFDKPSEEIQALMTKFKDRDDALTQLMVDFSQNLSVEGSEDLKREDILDSQAYTKQGTSIKDRIEFILKRNESYSNALAQTVEKLGGEARLGVTPDAIREVNAADVERMIKGIETIMDTVREVDTLRVQIKTVEEQLAKAKDDLDRANEEIAQQSIKIDSLKKLNEGHLIKITKLENRMRVLEGRTVTAGAGGRRYDGLVKKVNYDYNYIIINIGGEEKLIYGTQLTIARDREFICNVMVTKVYKKFAVAEILPENKQGEVLEGDRVLSLD